MERRVHRTGQLTQGRQHRTLSLMSVAVAAARTLAAAPGVIAWAPPMGRNETALIAVAAAAVNISFRMTFSPSRQTADGRPAALFNSNDGVSFRQANQADWARLARLG